MLGALLTTATQVAAEEAPPGALLDYRAAAGLGACSDAALLREHVQMLIGREALDDRSGRVVLVRVAGDAGLASFHGSILDVSDSHAAPGAAPSELAATSCDGLMQKLAIKIAGIVDPPRASAPVTPKTPPRAGARLELGIGATVLPLNDVAALGATARVGVRSSNWATRLEARGHAPASTDLAAETSWAHGTITAQVWALALAGCWRHALPVRAGWNLEACAVPTMGLVTLSGHVVAAGYEDASPESLAAYSTLGGRLSIETPSVDDLWLVQLGVEGGATLLVPGLSLERTGPAGRSSTEILLAAPASLALGLAVVLTP